MKVDELREQLSPLPFHQWVQMVNRHRVGDGRRSVTVVEPTPWGWLRWRVSCVGPAIDPDLDQLDGRVELLGVTARPVGTESVLRSFQMRAAEHSRTRCVIAGSSWRWGDFIAAATASPAMLGGLTVAFNGPAWGSTAMIVGGVGATAGWLRCLAQGNRQVRRLGAHLQMERTPESPSVDDVLVALVDIAALFPLAQAATVRTDIPASTSLHLLLWDLLAPDLTWADLEDLEWQTTRLRDALQTLHDQQQLDKELLRSAGGARAVPAPGLRATRQVRGALPFRELLDLIHAHTYGLQVTHGATRHALNIPEDPPRPPVDDVASSSPVSQFLAVSPVDTELVFALLDLGPGELTAPDGWSTTASGHRVLEVVAHSREGLDWLERALFELDVPVDLSAFNRSDTVGSAGRRASFQLQVELGVAFGPAHQSPRAGHTPVDGGSADTADLRGRRQRRAALERDAAQLVIDSHVAAADLAKSYLRGDPQQALVVERLADARRRFAELRQQYRATGLAPWDTWPYPETNGNDQETS